MPYTGSPPRSSAISVPHTGRPQIKDFVPSIGSSAQTYSASVRSLPYSSPMMPWSGKLFRIIARIAASAARSAAVTGSNPRPCDLFSMLSVVRKNGRIASPAAAASLSTKAVKSTAGMPAIASFGLSYVPISALPGTGAPPVASYVTPAHRGRLRCDERTKNSAENLRRHDDGRYGLCGPVRALHDEPVPAQFGERDRAQSGNGDQPL